MSDHDSRIEQVWMTPKEVAAYLRMSSVTVHRLLAAGALRSSQAVPGGRHLIHKDWADEYALNRRDRRKPRIVNGKRIA